MNRRAIYATNKITAHTLCSGCKALRRRRRSMGDVYQRMGGKGGVRSFASAYAVCVMLIDHPRRDTRCALQTQTRIN